MSNAAEESVKRFCDGCSCSQAVLSSYADRYGLEQTVAMRIAAGLGGGLGRMGGTCGALTGAALVLGLVLGLENGSPDRIDKLAKKATYDAVAELQRRFSERHGSILCRDLLQHDLSIPQQYLEAKALDLFKTECPAFVETTVEILDDLLQ